MHITLAGLAYLQFGMMREGRGATDDETSRVRLRGSDDVWIYESMYVLECMNLCMCCTYVMLEVVVVMSSHSQS